MDLDEVADRLYGMAPGEFTAARDALAKETKASGDVRLSREIGKLRKPTVVGWAVNQVSRRHPEELEGLLAVGRRLREAWQSQDAEALADLGRQRSAPEIEQTLDSAVVDETAENQVRQGRLVRGLSYSGFAPAPVVHDKPARGDKTSRRAKPSEAERRAAERDRRVRELEQALAEADQAATEAEESHAAWEAELAEAVQNRDRKSGKVAELTDKLARARQKLATAGQRLDVAKREETGARRAAQSARLRADKARATLQDLTPGEPG